MGRRRINQGKERRIISISLDREVLATFDETLGENTRSRRIESLIREYIRKTQTNLEAYQRHAYECLNCGRSWHQSKKHNPEWMICGGPRGCEQMKITYVGVYVEGEEE